MDKAEVVEFTEPWCSWAWGSEPKLRLLRWRYGDRLAWRRAFADLLPRAGTYDPASNRVPWAAGASAAEVAAYLRQAGEHTLMPGPDGLRWIPSSSEVAGRAVIAAALQGERLAERLLRAVRESLFIFCAPADTPERVVALAGAVPGSTLTGWPSISTARTWPSPTPPTGPRPVGPTTTSSI